MVSQPTFIYSKSAMALSKKRGRICCKLSIKTPEQRQHCSGVSIVNFEQISYIKHISCVSVVGSAHLYLFTGFDPYVLL